MSPLLAGDKPLFLLHRSYQGGDGFPALATAVAAAVGADVELGAVVNLPHHGSVRARAVLDEARGYDLRIADPSFHLHEAFGVPPSQAQRSRAPFLVGRLPVRPTPALIDGVLEAQRQAGATVLLTPTGMVGEVNPERALDDTMRWVHATRATDPAEPLLVGLTLSRAWLADPALREILLNEMVDSSEPNWYVRVRWAALRPSRGQLVDVGLLRGYRILAEVAASEGKRLLLPQTGLTGWLVSALGASGFSVGTGGPEQAYADQVIIRVLGPRRPPVPRYFEPTLLNTILSATQGQLAASGSYAPCPCRYCTRMRGIGPAIDATRWGGDLAARHLVVSLAALQSRLATPDRRSAARTALAAAQSVRDAASPRLTGEDRPAHLDVWQDLLA